MAHGFYRMGDKHLIWLETAHWAGFWDTIKRSERQGKALKMFWRFFTDGFITSKTIKYMRISEIARKLYHIDCDTACDHDERLKM